MVKVPYTRDELILLLDLYYRRGPSLHVTSPEVIELSRLLRKMDVYPANAPPMPDSFRSVNSVQKKIKGFQHADPDMPGGLYNEGRLTREILLEFRDDKETLHRLADEVRSRFVDEEG